jgi:hypothetical protein
MMTDANDAIGKGVEEPPVPQPLVEQIHRNSLVLAVQKLPDER